jgi:hypothetical protein
MMKLIGQNPDEFSTHSFRSGGGGGTQWTSPAVKATKFIKFFCPCSSEAQKRNIKFIFLITPAEIIYQRLH